jgi:hypothetical protein
MDQDTEIQVEGSFFHLDGSATYDFVFHYSQPVNQACQDTVTGNEPSMANSVIGYTVHRNHV